MVYIYRDYQAQRRELSDEKRLSGCQVPKQQLWADNQSFSASPLQNLTWRKRTTEFYERSELWVELWHDLYTERPSRPDDSTRDGLESQMLHPFVCSFNFCDFVYMLQADGAGDLVTRFASSLLNPGCFFQKVCCKWCFGNEREGTVRLDGYQGWDWNAGLDMCGPGVEFFAEVHGFDTPGTKSRTDGRSWCRFSCPDRYALHKMK